MKDIKNNDIKDDDKIIPILIYNYNHKTINEYLGDMLIQIYKKQDPNQQAVWNTDYTRLNYLIKELIDNSTSDWIVDKKGIKTKKYLINPLLGYIKPMLLAYQNKIFNKINEGNSNQCEKRMNDMSTIAEIIRTIDDGNLGNGILKYISPHFYLDNKLQLN